MLRLLLLLVVACSLKVSLGRKLTFSTAAGQPNQPGTTTANRLSRDEAVEKLARKVCC